MRKPSGQEDDYGSWERTGPNTPSHLRVKDPCPNPIVADVTITNTTEDVVRYQVVGFSGPFAQSKESNPISVLQPRESVTFKMDYTCIPESLGVHNGSVSIAAYDTKKNGTIDSEKPSRGTAQVPLEIKVADTSVEHLQSSYRHPGEDGSPSPTSSPASSPKSSPSPSPSPAPASKVVNHIYGQTILPQSLGDSGTMSYKNTRTKPVTVNLSITGSGRGNFNFEQGTIQLKPGESAFFSVVFNGEGQDWPVGETIITVTAVLTVLTAVPQDGSRSEIIEKPITVKVTRHPE